MRRGDGRRRALVVDGDPHVRRAIARELSLEAIDVVEAGSIAEALETLERSELDVVIADDRLALDPNRLGTGADLLAHVSRAHPTVGRILLASRTVGLTGVEYADVIVPKPWGAGELVQAVAKLLARV